MKKLLTFVLVVLIFIILISGCQKKDIQMTSDQNSTDNKKSTNDLSEVNNDVSSVRGNSIGNITNGGRLAKEGDNIYFSFEDWENDESGLYVKDEVENTIDKIVDGEITFIHVLDGWIYYCDYEDPGLYRIGANGADKEKLTEIDESYKCVDIVDDWIYYTSDGTLYKVTIDGKEKKVLLERDSWPDLIKVNVVDNIIYYSGDEGIYKMSIDGTRQKQIVDEAIYKMQVEGDWIYYFNDGDNGLNKVKTNGHSLICLEEAGTDHREDFLLVYNEWVYFSELAEDEHKAGLLFRIKNDGTSKELLADDFYTDINDETGFDNYIAIIDDKIYYQSSEDYGIYSMNIDGSNKTKFYPMDNNHQQTNASNVNESNIVYTRGNTTGNIINGGSIAKQDDWLFYSSRIDDYNIYKMRTNGSEKTKLNNERSTCINIVGDWVYYCNFDDDWKLYKMRTDGSSRNKINDDTCVDVNIVGDWIYYSNSADDFKLYKIRTDGSERTKINDEKSLYINVVDDWVYYENCYDEYTLYKIRTDGSSRTKLNDDNCKNIIVKDDWIYYINEDDNLSIYKIRTDGSGRTKLNSEISWTMNVEGDWIYFDDKDIGLYLFKMRTDGSEKTRLYDENIGYLNVVDDWVYYYNEDDDYKLYKVSIDGLERLPVE